MKSTKKNIVVSFFSKIAYLLAGSPSLFSLENRLFNSLALLNGLANTLGSLNYIHALAHVKLASLSLAILSKQTDIILFGLHFISGILLLSMYLYSRLRRKYYVLFWPFMLSIIIFLFGNVLYNSGSLGGAHYYFITAVLIGVILSPNQISTIANFVLCTGVAGFLFWIEANHPEWMKMDFASSPELRFDDVPSQFIFMQILNGILVLVLRRHFNEEREKSERLLLNILPQTIAEELKISEKVRPVEYEEASILFTDFVNFTRVAEQLSPQGLIEKLDDCFSHFDAISYKHKLEKIKTIGDSYMAAGGVPEMNNTHCLDITLAAMEMQCYMTTLQEASKEHGLLDWKLRIGVNTGYLVAGVIGDKKFAYDVWGDAVNIASRMESSSIPEKINVSADVYRRIKKYFECTYRGKVPAKNKGDIEMYFVERLKEEYSKDRAGFYPNNLFENEYREIEKNNTFLSPDKAR